MMLNTFFMVWNSFSFNYHLFMSDLLNNCNLYEEHINWGLARRLWVSILVLVSMKLDSCTLLLTKFMHSNWLSAFDRIFKLVLLIFESVNLINIIETTFSLIALELQLSCSIVRHNLLICFKQKFKDVDYNI